jgi:hypothetical protein
VVKKFEGSEYKRAAARKELKELEGIRDRMESLGEWREPCRITWWHSNFVRYCESYEHDRNLYSVFERSDGDLKDLLFSRHFEDNPPAQCACLLQCACALTFLHDKEGIGRVHRERP